MDKKRTQFGFTLVEVIIVLGLVAILVGIGSRFLLVSTRGYIIAKEMTKNQGDLDVVMKRLDIFLGPFFHSFSKPLYKDATKTIFGIYDSTYSQPGYPPYIDNQTYLSQIVRVELTSDVLHLYTYDPYLYGSDPLFSDNDTASILTTTDPATSTGIVDTIVVKGLGNFSIDYYDINEVSATDKQFISFITTTLTFANIPRQTIHVPRSLLWRSYHPI